MADKLKKLYALRQVDICKITAINEIANTLTEDQTTLPNFIVAYKDLSSIKEDFEKHHYDIVLTLAVKDDANLAAEETIRKDFSSLVNNVEAQHYTFVELVKERKSELSMPSHKSIAKLPKLNLKIFSGDIKEFPTFIDMFDSLVHTNSSMSDMDKFIYLLSVLTNEPLNLVKRTKFIADNYLTAYENLCKTYTNQRDLANVYWKEISETPLLSTENAQMLKTLLNTFEQNLSGLEKMGYDTEAWDFPLMNILLEKLDPSTARAFELDHGSTEVPTYKKLFSFLMKHCTALESCARFKRGKNSTSANFTKYPRKTAFVPASSNRLHSSFLAANTKHICSFCNADHLIYKCSKFLEKSPQDRFDFVKQLKCCINCLATAHNTINCTSEKRCLKCNKRHHTILHFYSAKDIQTSDILPGPSGINTSNNDSSHISTSLSNTALSVFNVLLGTVQIKVQDRFGNLHYARAILDSGSQINFISKNFFKKLSLPKHTVGLTIQGLDKMSTSANAAVSLKILSNTDNEVSFDISAIILEKICTDMPHCKLDLKNWSHINNLKLADPSFHLPGKIDLLLGADIYPYILQNGFITGGPNEPSAINTVFGWTIVGKIPTNTTTDYKSFFITSDIQDNLNFDIKQFWQIEEIPSANTMSPEDIICETNFTATTFRDITGRYTVTLPFKTDQVYFGDTRSLAIQRFYSLERKFAKNETLRLLYSDFINSFINKGYLYKIQFNNSMNNFYLPHHGVWKEDSLTTPLRVVFNASSHAPNFPSLNDLLYTGPKLQIDINKILLHFRLHKIVFTADIEKMYNQILIDSNQRKFQRIIWRSSPTEPLADYEIATITYGVVSSPYLAIRVLQQLAKEETEYPEASNIINNFTYVDDIASGADSLENAKNKRNQLINLLHKGGFTLRKWASNSSDFLHELPSIHVNKNAFNFDTENKNVIKLLGLQWDPNKDCFSYTIKVDTTACTKRLILSQIAKIFDPLGFLSPITLIAKQIIQKLWILGLGWDDRPPEHIINKWLQFQNDFASVEKFCLPRQIDLSDSLSCELHGFCDASEYAYCAVTYLRIIYKFKNIQTYLVCAKSKIAPVKKISVPRLELLAAVLLAKLISYITTLLDNKIKFSLIYAWSDSTIALTWIKSSPHKWKTFVANRVTYIQDKLDSKFWFYIPSALNPADIGSRGQFPSELVNNVDWWLGPSFLKNDSSNWNLPCYETLNKSDSSCEEKKSVLISYTDNNFIDSLLETYSSLNKIKKILAYILRFIHNTKMINNKISTHLTISELNNALLHIIKRVQVTQLSPEIDQIIRKKITFKPLRRLNPFLDSNNILRVGGRLSQATHLSYNKRFPILLPNNCKFTELLIKEIHKNFMHPGIQTTQFLLFQNYWIFAAKNTIRKIINNCHACWKTNPKPFQPPMGALPRFRISQIKPFSTIGVDFGGPFTITLGKLRGSKTTKAYICVFVCVVTKAVHVELASDLSTEAFLAAFRRFMSRRGRCSTIYSDCGTNFVGAHKYLKEIFLNATKVEAIEWKFNPPSAPHFSGLWEAGIKAVKTHLNRVIGDQILTYEELNTVLTQIEAVLNSRPLCSISSDPNDCTSLTPGHFLTQEPLAVLPDPNYTTVKLNHLTRWQLLQRMHHDFWKRWHQEYLHNLHQRAKWHNNSESPKIGTLVLIKNELSVPLQWPLGRIIDLHPGFDGIARVATVKTTKGIFKRPLVKLCPLPNYQ